jgi:DnaK suppressor protein
MNARKYDIDTVRTRLFTRREDLRDRLIRIGADQARAAVPLSRDSADRAIEVENDQVIDSIGAACRTELVDIDAALARLDAGRYGICEKCQHSIETRRINAVPYAKYCLRCASDADTSRLTT